MSTAPDIARQHTASTTDQLVVGEVVHGVSTGPGYRTEWHGTYAGTYTDDGGLYHLFRDGKLGTVAQPSFGIPAARLASGA